jgi:hypothetical protein
MRNTSQFENKINDSFQWWQSTLLPLLHKIIQGLNDDEKEVIIDKYFHKQKFNRLKLLSEKISSEEIFEKSAIDYIFKQFEQFGYKAIYKKKDIPSLLNFASEFVNSDWLVSLVPGSYYLENAGELSQKEISKAKSKIKKALNEKNNISKGTYDFIFRTNDEQEYALAASDKIDKWRFQAESDDKLLSVWIFKDKKGTWIRFKTKKSSLAVYKIYFESSFISTQGNEKIIKGSAEFHKFGKLVYYALYQIDPGFIPSEIRLSFSLANK